MRNQKGPDVSNDSSVGEAWLVYDGQCPFCSRYVRYVRLRESVKPLHLLDAREGGPVVEEIQRAGFDLNAGMVLKMGGRYYHGPDCIHALAMLSSPSSLFNKINAAIFRSPQLSRWLYPGLRAGRNAALWILGRGQIASLEAEPDQFADASLDVTNPRTR